MKGDSLIRDMLLLAQAIDSLADHLANSTGFQLTAVAFADLPTTPVVGMIACINNSTVNTWGSVIAGGGAFTVAAFFNGTNWTVMGV